MPRVLIREDNIVDLKPPHLVAHVWPLPFGCCQLGCLLQGDLAGNNLRLGDRTWIFLSLVLDEQIMRQEAFVTAVADQGLDETFGNVTSPDMLPVW